jgi:hypothetical protein
MMSTGLRKPGSEAIGSASCAHQTSPRSITIPHGVKIWIGLTRDSAARKSPPLYKRN